MSESRRIVLDTGSRVEDDLRLPRPPGVIRRFWSRHPLFADILIAVLAFLISIPPVAVRAPVAAPAENWWFAAGAVLALAGCVALVWRRRLPVIVFAVSILPAVVFEPLLAATLGGPTSLIAIYSIAVYRNARTCWIAFGSASAAILLTSFVRILLDPGQLGVELNLDISTIVFLLLGALVGINVGNRRRYLDALIDRSRQLLVERDQQGRLAAAAERTRIAREMHDIVSHSLTVVISLADGATATRDPRSAREATLAIADTARAALTEMRVMLGVLRDDETAPLAPAGDTTVQDVVAGARAAGAPVALSVTGAPDSSPAVRLATIRIVAEGLTNALRYARQPTRIRVDVVHRDGGAEVTVENDGASPDSPSQGAGLGLRGLQERVAHVDGTMEAGMIAPGVWRLHATIPGERGEHE